MTDIEQKALALVNEVFRERGHGEWIKCTRKGEALTEAICRAIERDKAFRQEVSDAVEDVRDNTTWGVHPKLWRFIIAKPLNPLAQAWREAWPGTPEENAIAETGLLLAAIEKRGGKIIFNEE